VVIPIVNSKWKVSNQMFAKILTKEWLTLMDCLILNPTLASTLSIVWGWNLVCSVEIYSVLRSHDTFLLWWRDLQPIHLTSQNNNTMVVNYYRNVRLTDIISEMEFCDGTRMAIKFKKSRFTRWYPTKLITE
jgi:hypothetical protein